MINCMHLHVVTPERIIIAAPCTTITRQMMSGTVLPGDTHLLLVLRCFLCASSRVRRPSSPGGDQTLIRELRATCLGWMWIVECSFVELLDHRTRLDDRRRRPVWWWCSQWFSSKCDCFMYSSRCFLASADCVVWFEGCLSSCLSSLSITPGGFT